MSQQPSLNNMPNFLEEILARAQRILANFNSFYKDCIILTQPADDALVISSAEHLQPQRILRTYPTNDKTRSAIFELRWVYHFMAGRFVREAFRRKGLSDKDREAV